MEVLGKGFLQSPSGFLPQNLIPLVQNAESLCMEDAHSETMRSKSYSKDGETRE